MEYQFITQSDIQFMGDSMMLKRIASRCSEVESKRIPTGHYENNIYIRKGGFYKRKVLDLGRFSRKGVG